LVMKTSLLSSTRNKVERMFKRESFGSPFFIFSEKFQAQSTILFSTFSLSLLATNTGKESRAAAPLRVRKVRAPENRIPVEKPDVGRPMMESAAENSPLCIYVE